VRGWVDTAAASARSSPGPPCATGCSPAAGALAALCVTALLGAFVVGPAAALPFLVAPIGASAVLVFAVPTSPLAQPWPVVGGNVLSTLVGLGVLALVDDPFVASGLAVGGAIAAMSLLRCTRPAGPPP